MSRISDIYVRAYRDAYVGFMVKKEVAPLSRCGHRRHRP
jgi:hypothetical protein